MTPRFVLEEETDLVLSEDATTVTMTGRSWTKGFARTDLVRAHTESGQAAQVCEPGSSYSWGIRVNHSTDDMLGVCTADFKAEKSANYSRAGCYLAHHQEGGCRYWYKSDTSGSGIGCLVSRDKPFPQLVGVLLFHPLCPCSILANCL